MPGSHVAPREATDWKRTSNKWLTIGVTAVGMIGVIGMTWWVFGPVERRRGKDGNGIGEVVHRGEKKKRRITLVAKNTPDAGEAAAKNLNAKIFACPIYTPEPGFFVLVDGEAARDAKGEKLTTPCEVGLPLGNHTLTVVREKFRDHSEEVLIAKERTIEIAPVYEPFAEPAGYFASPFATVAVGEPVELKSLNAGGPAWDPFVAPDSLSLWFAAQKEEGKGIFVARRASVTDDFGKPEMLVRNSDRPASPTVTEDQLVVAYSVRNKAQIRSLSRSETDAPFRQGLELAFSEREGEQWLSAQISSDGKTLYYVQERKGKTREFVAARKSLRKPFADDPAEISLPGAHPRLSHDGLRQYVYDGARLWRASRRDAEAGFSKPELVCPLEVGNYTAHAGYRQFCVSEDEQWMYYSDAPEESGKLYAVRIAEGPQRGFAPRGKPIPPKEPAQNSEKKDAPGEEREPTPEKMKEQQQEPPPVDPRTKPLPYAELRGQLDKLLAAYDFAAVEKLIDTALQDPRYNNDRALLDWDGEDIGRISKFWQRLEAAIAALKPGEVVRAGSLQLEFGKYEDGTFSGKARGSDKSVSRTIHELTPVDLVTLVDRHVGRSDEAAQLEIGAFLAESPKVSQQLLASRLERAGEKGKEVLERRRLRKLHLAEQEIARENIGAGLQLLDQLVAAAPKSKTAAQARALRDSLPARLIWTPIGPQTWNTAVPGEYAASSGKAPGAYLISASEYGKFVLTLEWKTASDTGQGGVYFRYQRGNDLRKNAFKIHLAGDHAIRATPDRFSTGSLFGIRGPRTNAVRPTGEWNTLTLRVEGDRVRATVNGVEVLDTPASDPNIGPHGYICLDGEFGGITYRKVLVYEVPGGEP
ncbi:MAG: family 16 glycoside hydrolase [Deltaproteobacteria bacterium]